MAKYIIEGVDYGRNLHDIVAGTRNFQYWEFVSSQLAVRNGIKNIPNEIEWRNIEFLAANALQPLRDLIGGVSISSGFRCKKLNDLAGSSDSSHHRNGCAVDIEPKEVSLIAAVNVIVKNLKYTEVIAEYFPDGWVHYALVNGRKDTKIKLKDAKHNFDVISIDKLNTIYK